MYPIHLWVFFSQTCSLMIYSSSVYCPHFKTADPPSLILGASAEKEKKNCVSLLTHMILEID